MRRLLMSCVLAALGVVAAAGPAQAVVVDMGPQGRFGVALVPGTRSTLTTAGISAVTASPPCSDPWLASDFVLPDSGLCYHGGPVMHANETFAVTWDPHRLDWQTTRDYVEQFFKDVGDGSGTLTSPYALTGQYSDAGGRARNASAYGGGCVDFGSPGGSTCKFPTSVVTGVGHNDAGNDCTPSGNDTTWEDASGAWGDPHTNDYCISDAQIRTEVAQMVGDMGLIGRTQPGYTPIVVLRTPPDVVDCIDTAGHLCSANSTADALFCSYHGQVNVNGTDVSYVVQPWTVLTGCDDPGLDPWKWDVDVHTAAVEAGQRLVSPISQAHLAAITDPGLNAWYATDGSEMNDNGCIGFPKKLDSVTVGKSGQNPYWLQREFNNAGAIASDPNAPKCAPNVLLGPTFVVPSPINAGDIVAFDGSVTASTLLISQPQYVWSFGDGTGAQGASVIHSYARGGVYSVKLTVTDRGGNTNTTTESVTVLGPGGEQPPPPGGNPKKPRAQFQLRLQLVPQGLKSVLRSGVIVRVSSSEPADGISSVTITRATARRAHIRSGRGPDVRIGHGTVAGIKNGTITLHLRLDRGTAAKIARLHHVKLSVKLQLVGPSGDKATGDAAGSY
jgi:PKD domain